MRDQLETAAKAWDSWEKFVTIIVMFVMFVMFAMFGFGLYLIVAPDRVPEDAPDPLILGGVVCGVSGLFLLALLTKGRFASRAKNLLLFLAFGAVAGGMGYAAVGQAEVVYRLKTEGIERQLTVVGNEVRMIDGSPLTKVLMMDGDRRITLDWNGRIERGTMMTVLTHPEHGGWTAATPEGSTYLEVADALEVKWAILIAAGIALVAGFAALIFFWSFATGGAAPDETPDAAYDAAHDAA